ncbi:F0F1-type ATP synthase assembly protein I [Conyzicola nivalis]|uniref:F0F1-type ATP synthase assembly protein I n=1 Tax=Conyzicola nivalis TaxID=1477021 RepID=A0ABV2QTZ6_9MICO
MSTTPSDDQDAANETEVQIRRAPKYSAFIIVGGGIGAVITFILTAIFPVDPLVGFGALFGYFALYGVTAGVLVGALLALLLDRIGLRRSRPATVVTAPSDDSEPTVYVTDEPAAESPDGEPAPGEPAPAEPAAEPVEAPAPETPPAPTDGSAPEPRP